MPCSTPWLRRKWLRIRQRREGYGGNIAWLERRFGAFPKNLRFRTMPTGCSTVCRPLQPRRIGRIAGFSAWIGGGVRIAPRASKWTAPTYVAGSGCWFFSSDFPVRSCNRIQRRQQRRLVTRLPLAGNMCHGPPCWRPVPGRGQWRGRRCVGNLSSSARPLRQFPHRERPAIRHRRRWLFLPAMFRRK